MFRNNQVLVKLPDINYTFDQLDMGDVVQLWINHLGDSPLQGGVHPKVEMAETSMCRSLSVQQKVSKKVLDIQKDLDRKCWVNASNPSLDPRHGSVFLITDFMVIELS